MNRGAIYVLSKCLSLGILCSTLHFLMYCGLTAIWKMAKTSTETFNPDFFRHICARFRKYKLYVVQRLGKWWLKVSTKYPWYESFFYIFFWKCTVAISMGLWHVKPCGLQRLQPVKLVSCSVSRLVSAYTLVWYLLIGTRSSEGRCRESRSHIARSSLGPYIIFGQKLC